MIWIAAQHRVLEDHQDNNALDPAKSGRGKHPKGCYAALHPSPFTLRVQAGAFGGCARGANADR